MHLPLGLQCLQTAPGMELHYFSSCLAAGAHLLVVDSEAVCEELRCLQRRLAPGAYQSLLDQFGVVYEWLGGGGGRPQFELVERTAARYAAALVCDGSKGLGLFETLRRCGGCWGSVVEPAVLAGVYWWWWSKVYGGSPASCACGFQQASALC